MELRYKNRNQWTKIYSGLLCENIIQALARGVIVEALVEIGDLYGVALQVHDEIVSVVPTSVVEEAKKAVTAIMVKPVPWLPGCPIACETESGPSYGTAK
jgi:rRNA processing protein Krr1/Pno1